MGVVGEEPSSAIERQRLLRHSSAAMWMAISAEVVGGCGEGWKGGGYERGVGLMNVRHVGTIKAMRSTDFAVDVCPFVPTGVSSIIPSSSIGSASSSSSSSSHSSTINGVRNN